jgi:hypothetical protein
MTRELLVIRYDEELNSIENQITTLGEFKQSLQSSINELISPISQLDERIAEITVNINKKIYELSGISSSAVFCGCGTHTTDGDGNSISVGTTYFYEQAKAHRINAESTSYSGLNPFGNLEGTDGSTSFTAGIGSTTIVVGADKSAILELIVDTPGSGFISSTYYGRILNGGSGSGAKADITVSAAGTVSNVIVNNGGSGYLVNDNLTITSFAGASFKVTDVGSPILGIGVDTYIVASSGIGSIFIPDVDSSKTSTCGVGSACSDFASKISAINNEITTLRNQRNEIIVGSNSLKVETRRSYTQRYSYNFAEGELNVRKNEISAIKSVLGNPNYNQYFS